MNSRISQMFQSIRLQSTQPSSLQLKVGQIVTGKVEKFLPQNKALIHIGAQTVVADLKNTLLANQRYMFQVKHVVPFINLQVLSERPIRNNKDSVTNLLNNFGLKSTDKRERFISLLLREQVPIKGDAFKAAISILDGEQSSSKANLVLLEMLKRELPITKNVFDSLFQRMFEPQSLSRTAETLSIHLQEINSIDSKQLRSLLTLLSQGQSELKTNDLKIQILNEVWNGTTTSFNVLKKAGFITEDVTYSKWKEAWTAFSKSEGITQLTLIDQVSKSTKQMPLLSFDNMDGFFKGLQTLGQSGEPLTKQEKAMLNLWLLQGLSSLEKGNHTTLKDSFFIKLQGFVSMLNGDLNKSTSLPMLLQSVMKETNHPLIKQDISSLLQVINGIHLSQFEQNEWKQFSIQLPAKLFGLKKDILMDFEGKKDAKGKIDANYCRVMFYLDLESLKEVVIDMKVQNRFVTLTIYHDNPSKLAPIVQLIQPNLTEQLKEKNYQISSVFVKELRTSSVQHPVHHTSQPPRYGKGVDLQI